MPERGDGTWRTDLRRVLCALFLSASLAGNATAIEVADSATSGCERGVVPPAPASAVPDGASKIVAPERGLYAGLYAISGIQPQISAYEQKAGQFPSIVFTFHDWVSDEDWDSRNPHLRTLADPLENERESPLVLADRLAERGGVLALAWALQCCQWDSYAYWFGLRSTTVSVERLLSGRFDDYLRTVAGQLRQFGKPIMLSLFSEFNFQGMFAFGADGDESIEDAENICNQYGDPTWPDGPERIRDSYRYVIDFMRQQGVTNVTWFMYAATNYMDPDHEDQSEWLHPRYFYPGDAYMDWVGQSVYFSDPALAAQLEEPVTGIQRALMPGYEAWGTVTQKPLFLPEFGFSGDSRKSRAPIIADTLRTTLPSLPRVKAVTLADFEIAAVYYEVPMLGAFPDEIEALRTAIGGGAYTHELRIR